MTHDHADFLQRFLDVLAEARVRHCVLGGQGVNAYVDPVVSLDLVIAAADATRIEAILCTGVHDRALPAQSQRLRAGIGSPHPDPD